MHIRIVCLCMCGCEFGRVYVCPHNMIVCVCVGVCVGVCVSVCVPVCVPVCMCSCVCLCMRACLSLIYSPNLQFMYQILLLQMKVLLPVVLRSILITNSTLSMHLKMQLEKMVLPFSRYPRRIGLPKFRRNYRLLLVPSFP